MMLSVVRAAFAIIQVVAAVVLAGHTSASCAKTVALVVANGDYAPMSKVDSSAKDGAAIADRLKSLGVEIWKGQTLVNLNEVRKYIKGEGGVLVMSDGSSVDVSRSKKEQLLKKLQVK